MSRLTDIKRHRLLLLLLTADWTVDCNVTVRHSLTDDCDYWDSCLDHD